MDNLIITGVNGLLGQKILEQAASDYAILGVDIHDEPAIQKIKFDYLKLDITDRRLLKDTVLNFYPNYIINTAAMTNVDGCEDHKEDCWRINVEAVENLIYAARKIGSRMVQLSTDYIFDGKNGPYSEDDTPAPQGYYGKSKLASENLLRSSELDFTIVRTMVLYGVANNVRPNFVTWLISALKSDEEVTIVNDQFGSPTLADDLAAAILQIVKLDKWDTFHISGSEIIDRYRFALQIADTFGLNKKLIKQITTSELQQKAPRPLKSGFNIDKATNELGVNLSNIEQGLKKFKKQYKKYK